MSDTEEKVPTFEEIELRAYEIYLKRGDAEGIATGRLARCREGTIGIKGDGWARRDAPVVKRAADCWRRVVAWLVVRRHRLTEMLQAHLLMLFLTSL